MAGHGRSKDGVASLVYVSTIHVFDDGVLKKASMSGTSPGMMLQELLRVGGAYGIA